MEKRFLPVMLYKAYNSSANFSEVFSDLVMECPYGYITEKQLLSRNYGVIKLVTDVQKSFKFTFDEKYHPNWKENYNITFGGYYISSQDYRFTRYCREITGTQHTIFALHDRRETWS